MSDEMELEPQPLTLTADVSHGKPIALDCFALISRPPEIVPGRPQRAWMDKFHERHP